MNEMSRRSFFGRVIAWIMGGIAACLAVPILGYTVYPAFRPREEDWADAGPVGKLEVNIPRETEIVHTMTSGYMKTNSVRSIWAFKTEDGKIVAYSPNCTHLGCAYQWEESRNRFECPCHNSIFDISGKVISGPAPRPLDTLPVRQEGERFSILYQEFKAGLPKREEL